MAAPLHLVLCFASILLLGVAAAHDVVARTVPAGLSGTLAGLGLLDRLITGGTAAALVGAAVVFAVTALCWWRGWMGGGDVKLLSAASLAVAPADLPRLLAGTALAGAALALLYWLARGRVAPAAARARRGLLLRAVRAERWRLRRGGPLPYAVAIAVGAVWSLTGGIGL